MFKELSEIAPVSAVVAVAAWGAISYFIVGPEAATRIAKADYFESCEQRLLTTISTATRERERQIDQPNELEEGVDQANRQFERLEQQYPEHTQLLDLITGGGFSGSIENANRAAARVRQAKIDALAAIHDQAERAAESAPDQCSCQIQAALGETRTEWATFVATFTLIEQDGVTNFPALMRANTRYCAERTS